MKKLCVHDIESNLLLDSSYSIEAIQLCCPSQKKKGRIQRMGRAWGGILDFLPFSHLIKVLLSLLHVSKTCPLVLSIRHSLSSGRHHFCLDKQLLDYNQPPKQLTAFAQFTLHTGVGDLYETQISSCFLATQTLLT